MKIEPVKNYILREHMFAKNGKTYKYLKSTTAQTNWAKASAEYSKPIISMTPLFQEFFSD